MNLRGAMAPSPCVMNFPRPVAISYSNVKDVPRACFPSIAGLDSGDTKMNKPWPLPSETLRTYVAGRQVNKQLVLIIGSAMINKYRYCGNIRVRLRSQGWLPEGGDASWILRIKE